MNTAYQLRTPDAKARGLIRVGAGMFLKRLIASLLCLSVCAGLTGCFGFLKPAPSTSHYFVLTPLPAEGSGSTISGSIALGVGKVKLPDYLFNTSLAVRRGTNEISYLQSMLWAERLDTGFQRVLAADLGVLLPTDQIRLSAWRGDEVSVGVYVTIEQFDVEVNGQGMLVARWRILSPTGDKTLKAGEFRHARKGPSPDADASGSVATLSELLGEFSRQVAQAIRDAAPPGPGK